jgi:hypothetical protein
MGSKSKMKVTRSMLLRVRIKNCGIGIGGIYKFFMLHLEVAMTKGLRGPNDI